MRVYLFWTENRRCKFFDESDVCIVPPRFSSSPLLSLRRSSLVEERLDEDLLMPRLLGRHR